MSLMDQLSKKSPAPAPPNGATASTTAPTPPARPLASNISPKTGKPIPPPAGMSTSGPYYTDQQQHLLGVDRDGIPVKPLLVIDRTKGTASMSTPPVVPMATGILPPDAPKSDPSFAVANTGGALNKIDQVPAIVKDPAVDTEPKKRGRPAGAKNKDPEQLGADMSLSLRIFVDCVPATPASSLDSYVTELHGKVCAAANVPDIALVEYGKGKGMMRAAAQAGPPPAGTYVVFTSDLNAPVIEALSPFVVARGAR